MFETEVKTVQRFTHGTCHEYELAGPVGDGMACCLYRIGMRGIMAHD
jgi:hypothetical protein